MERVRVEVIDDLDGESAADDRIEFTWEGVSYRLDLNAKNAKKLRDSIAPYIGAAQRVGGKRTNNARRGPAKVDKEQLAHIRTWAKDHGYEVSDRGRIPVSVQEAYAQAHA